MCWQKDLAIDGFPGVSELSDNALGQCLSLACGTDEVIDFELNDVGPRIDFLHYLMLNKLACESNKPGQDDRGFVPGCSCGPQFICIIIGQYQ